MQSTATTPVQFLWKRLQRKTGFRSMPRLFTALEKGCPGAEVQGLQCSGSRNIVTLLYSFKRMACVFGKNLKLAASLLACSSLTK